MKDTIPHATAEPDRGFAVRLGLVLAGATLMSGIALWLGWRAGDPPASSLQAGGNNIPPSRTADEQAAVCSARTPPGVGLHGAYFARENLEGPRLMLRTDNTVDIEPDGTARSIRWTGWVRAPMSGRFRFHVDYPDARVIVSKHDFSPNAKDPAGALEAQAGRYYPITVELPRLHFPGQRIRLEWTQPFGVRAVIPKVMLYLPMASASS